MKTRFDEDKLQLTVVISGSAETVMREVRRMREQGVTADAHLEALVLTPDHSGRMRRTDKIEFPAITEGHDEDALRQVDYLARQCRVDANMERRMDDIIKELARWTARVRRRDYWYAA